ncbi:MAG: DUF393 domain-containing protein [Burkholderiaceae bacterium]|nr:DUF393 domain-containing protein [Burkholderiaceae bacterium]
MSALPSLHAPAAPALTVYYDGSCPLCQREIALYRRHPGSQAWSWVDVSQPAALGDGLDCAQAMARFHVRTADGALFEGAAAFSQLWRRLHGWRGLGWLSAAPPLSWLLEALYRGFLPLRPHVQRWALRRWGPASRQEGPG